MFDSLLAQGHISQDGENPTLTDTGAAFAADFEIDLDSLNKARTPLCRECLDWRKRRSHLAGSLGRALLTRFDELSWAKRNQKTRVVSFSRSGVEAFQRLFPVVAPLTKPDVGASAAK